MDYPQNPDITNAKMFTWAEANLAQRSFELTDESVDKLLLVGWLWKNPRHSIRWTFTRDLFQRTYPHGAMFVPVYGEGKK
jgi:hypothetical protein